MTFLNKCGKTLGNFRSKAAAYLAKLRTKEKKHTNPMAKNSNIPMISDERNRGLAMLEASFSFPIVLMLIFFMLEMLRVNTVKTALETIATETLVDFAVSKKTTDFAATINKYKPAYIKAESIKYYFAIYENFDQMCAESPFGSEDIYWPGSAGLSSGVYLPSRGDDFLARKNDLVLTDRTKPETNAFPDGLNNKVFVLTFVCDFSFSSSFVGKMFAGGSNAKGLPPEETKFVLFSRRVGVCSCGS
jgi:hypothetical protein